jgi:hypothetical protein
MTLISAAIHKHQAFIATDSRTTNLTTGEIHSEDTAKSMMIDTKDGKILIGYTGTAQIDDVDTLYWITDILSKIGIKGKTMRELFIALNEELKNTFGNLAGGALGLPAPSLVIVIAGWQSGNNRYPLLLELSNILGFDKNGKSVTSHEFSQTQPALMPNGTGVHIAGDMRTTNSTEFKRKKKAIQKLLNQNSNKLDSFIESSIADLIITAAQDVRSKTINDQVITARIGKKSQGLEAGYYPNNASVKSYPGYVDGNIAISGVKIYNDPIEGGRTVIGGNGKFPVKIHD